MEREGREMRVCRKVEYKEGKREGRRGKGHVKGGRGERRERGARLVKGKWKRLRQELTNANAKKETQ